MDNKIKKADSDRKSKLVKDAGDVRKIEKSITSGSSQLHKINKDCGRGDSSARVGVEKTKFIDKQVFDVLPIKRVSSQQKEIERKPKELLAKIAEMKKIRENYTFRNKYSCLKRGNSECIKKNSVHGVESEIRNDRAPKPNEEEVKATATTPNDRVSSAKVSSNRGSAKTDHRRKTPTKTIDSQLIRRPIIKTITSKNDKGKVYKAVNFVEKRAQPMPLQINIPTDMKKPKETREVASKISVKEKRRREKKRRGFKPPVSPDVTVKMRSPPTEVAKWANVDNHTRLYYEAWVDTTLAAISKKSNNKKLDKQKLMQSFQKALAERPISPEIDYKMLLDEKYTGKIRVNKR